MRRTRTTAPLFEVETKQGSSSSIAHDEIEEYVIPKLRECGFRARLITAEKYNEKLEIKPFESKLGVDPRALLQGAGMMLEVWKKDNPTYRIAFKTFVVDKTTPKAIGNRPRLNIGKDLYKFIARCPGGIYTKLITPLFDMVDLHFLIVSKTGQFWAGKFGEIPDKSYYMSWRRDPQRLDRIATVRGEQEAQFHSIRKEFENRMLTLMYYFNKFHKYGNQ